MKALLIRMIAFCLLLMIPGVAFSQLVLNAGYLSLNGIGFRLAPIGVLRNSSLEPENLVFSSQTVNVENDYQIICTSDKLILHITFSPQPNLGNGVWQVNVTADYPADISLYTLALNFDWLIPQMITPYLGTQAIYHRNLVYNQDLVPYRDKIAEYATPDTSFWLLGSNYAGCNGVERVEQNTVYFYDYRLHHSRIYDKHKHRFDQKTDTKPYTAGEQESFSFLISGTKPPMPKINRWTGDNLAALSISNDADGSLPWKMNAMLYGSTDSASPKYLTQGLFAHHLKISHTVFGAAYTTQSQIWSALQAHGCTIGYHTRTQDGDFTGDTGENLLNQMQPYDIRMWIDHSWYNNAEDFCRTGTDSASPYYILDVINNSNIDYAWMGDLPTRNEINAFDNPWRLPHRIYEFTGLTRPVWFFGRTRMETLQYFGDKHDFDIKHNLTRQNLDNLLSEEGLCLIYTHFYFDDSSHNRTYFEIMPNGSCQIRDEADAYFALLEEYQNTRKLWVDTTENILDRMLAIEQVRVVNVSDATPGYRTVTLQNGSDYDLTDLALDFEGTKIRIPLLAAGASYSIDLSTEYPPVQPVPAIKLSVFYLNSSLYIKSHDNEMLPEMNITVYNTKGQQIRHTTLSSQNNTTVLPFSGHPNGIYFVRIQPHTGKTITRKILIMN